MSASGGSKHDAGVVSGVLEGISARGRNEAINGRREYGVALCIEEVPEVSADVVGGGAALNGEDLFHSDCAATKHVSDDV